MSRITCELDPFSPEFRADPYARYAQMRALGPVVWLERYGIWAVTSYAAVKACLLDHRTFSNAGGGGLANYFVDPPWRRPSIILEVDPPEHDRTRNVLLRVFSRPVLQKLKRDFEREADGLVARALEAGTLDAIPNLVQPFPLTVFGDAVGLAREDRRVLLQYGAMVFGAFGPPTAWHQDLMKDAAAVSDWIWSRCGRERLSAGGLGADIYARADAGDIDEEEARLLVRSLLSAGVDTTIDSIGLTLHCLMQHPEQWDALRKDPGLARGAFEEATRYDSSSQSVIRTALHPTAFFDAEIGRFDKVMVFLGSAGRDPAYWDRPEVFDIRRQLAGQVGYGAGIHGCVAQMMARLEGQVFFEALARRARRLEPAGPSQLRLNPGLRGLASLPLAIE